MNDWKIILQYELYKFRTRIRNIWNSPDFFILLGLIVAIVFFFNQSILFASYLGTGLILFGLVHGRYNKTKKAGAYISWDRERKGIIYNNKISEKQKDILISLGRIEAEIERLKKEIGKG